jgi:hypothetical protein
MTIRLITNRSLLPARCESEEYGLNKPFFYFVKLESRRKTNAVCPCRLLPALDAAAAPRRSRRNGSFEATVYSIVIWHQRTEPYAVDGQLCLGQTIRLLAFYSGELVNVRM